MASVFHDTLLADVELPLLRTLAVMERDGIAVDADYLDQLQRREQAQQREQGENR